MTLKSRMVAPFLSGAQVTVNGQDGSAALVDTDGRFISLVLLADKRADGGGEMGEHSNVGLTTSYLPYHKGIAGLALSK